MKLNSIEEIIDDIRLGKMVILMDDEDRENEGDLIIAAERVRTEDVNFMATNARGLICLTLTGERCKHLKLPLMVDDNNTPYNTNFTVSIEAASGVTTGISAADRARTIQVAVARDSEPEDIVQPGHIFRSWPSREAFCVGRGIPKRVVISRGWRAISRRQPS